MRHKLPHACQLVKTSGNSNPDFPPTAVPTTKKMKSLPWSSGLAMSQGLCPRPWPVVTPGNTYPRFPLSVAVRVRELKTPTSAAIRRRFRSILPVGKETHGLTLKSSSNRVNFSNIAREILRTGCLWEQQPLYKPMMIFRKSRRFVGKIKALGVEHSVEGQIQIFASRLRLLLDGRPSEK